MHIGIFLAIPELGSVRHVGVGSKSVVSDLTLSDEGTREENLHNFVLKVIDLERRQQKHKEKPRQSQCVRLPCHSKIA